MFQREKFYCAACDKLLAVSPAMFKVGGQVSFTKAVSNRGRIRMTSAKGIVLSLDESTLQVLYKGQPKTMSYKDCSPFHVINQPVTLTHALIGNCQCAPKASAVETE